MDRNRRNNTIFVFLAAIVVIVLVIALSMGGGTSTPIPPNPGVVSPANPNGIVVVAGETPQATLPSSNTPVTVAVSSPPISISTTTVLLFDTSGSMEGQDSSGISKISAAIGAGQNIVSMLQSENQSAGTVLHELGLAHFNNESGVDNPISGSLNTVSNSLAGLVPNGGTGMAAGLKTAIELFPQGQTDDKRILVLLSDGQPNISLAGNNSANDKDLIREEILNLALGAGKQGICIYTIGLGDPSAPQTANEYASIDEDLLKQIAQNSGCGTYSNARNSMQLANVYIGLRHQATGDIVLQKNGKISQGQTLEIGGFPVDQERDRLYLTLNWPGSKLESVLTDPQGKTVDAQYPGATINATKTLNTVLINNPVAGQWTLKAVGVDVPEGITDFNAIVSMRRGAVPIPTAVVIPPGPPPSGLGVFLLILVLVGGGLGTYIIAHKRSRPRIVSAGLILTSAGGQRIQITQDAFTIGRDPTCSLVLDDVSVSRSHAVLRFSQNAWYLQDSGSKGGTFVNGNKVTGTRLNIGDRITIGKSNMTFVN